MGWRLGVEMSYARPGIVRPKSNQLQNYRSESDLLLVIDIFLRSGLTFLKV
jgi:hypothetical protein